jgi:hypothetical protein
MNRFIAASFNDEVGVEKRTCHEVAERGVGAAGAK